MNETIQLLKNHRSVRDFDTEKEVSEAQIQAIIEAAMAGPNWINGQQVTVIEVRKPERKAALAKAAGNQRWVEEAPVFLVFCIDFYRAKLAADKNGTGFKIIEDLEAIIVGSTDVGIALGSAVIAAESMGLGIVPIGGLRRNPQTFVDLLNLPEYVFPVSGLVVGYPKSIPAQKPRLPIKATLQKEQYDAKIQKEIMDQYDQTISSYMSERTSGQDTSDWSSKIAQFYDTGFAQYAKNSSPTVKNQRFRYK
ncbi:NADPH-dependent oxidoreductase [Neobacillus sp. OS1-33]|uniref:NADPH-dependent oxidoreductase n=1 Tax=Neobacillus sp. OS1-33 TaxID=3070683 RepID=UPI0027E08234|nr:NADPH-dependent oxidoreductase [Neobacillus sp. OS1-33]WML26204.1 NADPH-dependent oxidoreductase [Neobacillus sp. OS1-33]